MLSEKEIVAKIRQQKADEQMIAEMNWSPQGEFAKDFGKACMEVAHELLNDIVESNARLEKLDD